MFLENTFIYFVAVFTSVAIFFFGVRRLGLETRLLHRVIREALQYIGAFIAFFLLNLGIGALVIFLIRGVWRFVPLYTLADAVLPIVSAIQGVVFQLWWRASRSRASGCPG